MGDESADGLLRAFLAASGEGEADGCLGRILEEVARPLVGRVVRTAGAGMDAEDVVADTLADLLRRLREAREDRGREIRDLRAYIITAAYNRCHERLRERHPARNRLRNQLQYLCGHDARLAVWRAAADALVCGLREWTGREAVGAERAARVTLAARSDPSAENRAQLVALTPAVLREIGGPVELDVLVATMARLIGLEPGRVEVPLESLAVAEVPADDAFEQRVSLRQLWADVQELVPRQRAALLLNLRDVQGRECLSLLPLTRTATMAEIAAAVEMAPERFAALWSELPMSDAAIGELLGMTGRQVIKLRRLARERLRRMEKNRTRQNLGRDLDSSKGKGR